MVILLELDAGRPSGPTTGDVDVVLDVRVLADGTRIAAERLVAAGFEMPEGSTPIGSGAATRRLRRRSW